MEMPVDQARQEHLLDKIENFAGVVLSECIESAYIDDPASFKRNCAVLNRRAIHCYDCARANDHFSPVSASTSVANIDKNNATLTERRYGSSLPFTTLRHSATSRLHGSWHSSGIVAVAGVADPGPPSALI